MPPLRARGGLLLDLVDDLDTIKCCGMNRLAKQLPIGFARNKERHVGAKSELPAMIRKRSAVQDDELDLVVGLRPAFDVLFLSATGITPLGTFS